MMTTNYIRYFIFMMLIFVACTKDEYEGPSLQNLYGEFSLLSPFSISNLNPDFSNNEMVKFHCEFNKSVDWKITIRGLQTGSVKEITGFSNKIDSGLVSWNGNTSEVPFFSEETCALELSFLTELDTLRDTLTILGKKVYEGIMVADFENGIPQDALVFHQFSMNMTFETASDDPLNGNSYFKMGGRMGWNEWFLGSIDFPLDMSAVNSSADEFYINLGVLSGINGEVASDQFINILISESNHPFNDDLTNNASDVFQDTMEVYKYQIRPVDWIGWNMISISYDQFEVKSSGGNNIRQPNNITAIKLQCQSCPGVSANCPENMSVDVRTDVDFLIFTEGTDVLNQ